MTSFLDALKVDNVKKTRTENGAVTYASTANAVLDFFALAGAKRNDVEGAKTLFRKAFKEDRQLAIRALFYLRDIRGGQGERQLFRVLFRELIRMNLSLAEKLVVFVPEYGRWDDLVSLYGFGGIGTAIRDTIKTQYILDVAAMDKGQSVSLMAKWLPSENASSATSREYARQLAADLDWSNKEYRKRVVSLRKHIGLLEQQMSEKNWDEVNYSAIPSQAGRKHSKAFKRHDEERYSAFLDRATKGEVKLNAGTVFTYEVVDMVRKGQDDAANAVWNNLPDYTDGRNAIVVADTSGSMGSIQSHWGATGTQPIDVSTSLALYFAEHNTGPFHNHFMTFSTTPTLVEVIGDTLTEKLSNISTANWSMSTNIEAVFDQLLRVANRYQATADDMPKTIYIVSDMEFNSVRGGTQESNYESAKRKFATAGYDLPHVVFWNVASRNNSVPATIADHNVTLISGLSQSTFRYAVEGKTPMESMLSVLNGERYAPIEVE